MQKHTPPCCAVLLLAVCTASGCSQSSAPIASSSSADPMASFPPAHEQARVSAEHTAPIDCNKLFSPADVADIMPGAVTVSAYAEGDNACVFKSADDSQVLQVSGDGDLEKALWTDPEVNQRDNYYQRISGIGDEAFFKTPDGAQLYVKKGDHYCGVLAGINQPNLTGEALARRLGALCNKYFAGH